MQARRQNDRALVLPEGVAHVGAVGAVPGAHVVGVQVVAVDHDVARLPAGRGIAEVDAVGLLAGDVEPVLDQPLAEQAGRFRLIGNPFKRSRQAIRRIGKEHQRSSGGRRRRLARAERYENGRLKGAP